MTTPLSKIEKGIIDGDWKLVCEGFNRITGKNLEPPKVIVETIKPFDPSKAKKADLYKKLLELMPLEPVKNYSTEELREMYLVHSLEESEPEQEQITPKADKVQELKVGKMLDGFRFTSGKGNLLPMDKEPLVATLDPQLTKVKDPEKEYVPREAPQKIKAKCHKCGKIHQTIKAYGVTLDGETKALCRNCQETL